MPLQSPIITSVDSKKWKSFTDFMAQLRADNTLVAGLEAERLQPYLDALTEQLKIDRQALPAAPERVAGMAAPGQLRKLFNAVAASTGNVILSEIMIAPENLLEQAVYEADTSQFNGKSEYEGRSFTLSFIQAFDRGHTHSVSIPVLAFDTEMMGRIETFQPERLLQAFQSVMTAGNHDMQHHYTNTTLNPSIALTSLNHEISTPGFTNHAWNKKYFSDSFGDTSIQSYESWLMLNHARIRQIMEKGPEGEALKKSVDAFFDELTRIGREMTASSPVTAHTTVDYFSTMLGFAMMRFMPLDHPLMTHAIQRMEKADPDAKTLTQKKEYIVKTITGTGSGSYGTLVNYKAKGVVLIPETLDYFHLKRLQLVLVAPWIADLMSPAQPGTPLAAVQERVGAANRDMIEAAAMTSCFNPVDGMQRIDLPDGGSLEVHHKDGVPHRDDGPAAIRVYATGARTEMWYQQGKLHRDDGPAMIKIMPPGNFKTFLANLFHAAVYGARRETWYKNGAFIEEKKFSLKPAAPEAKTPAHA